MVGLTSAQIVSEVEFLIELSGTDVDTSVLRYLDLAGRELWNARPWKERQKEANILTVAPYQTGAVTVTNLSTTLTGSGTTFTSAMVGMKFTLGTGGPWYRISGFTSVTQLTLARAYQEVTASAQGYTIYQDEYDVGTDVEVVRECDLLLSRYRGKLRSVNTADLDGATYMTSSISIPQAWALCTETTAGSIRVRLWPIPDTVYAFRCLYLKSWTPITAADTTLHALGPNKDRLLIYATTLLAQKLAGVRQVTSEAEVMALTEKCWQEQQEQVPMFGNRRAFDKFDTFANDIQINVSTL